MSTAVNFLFGVYTTAMQWSLRQICRVRGHQPNPATDDGVCLRCGEDM